MNTCLEKQGLVSSLRCVFGRRMALLIGLVLTLGSSANAAGRDKTPPIAFERDGVLYGIDGPDSCSVVGYRDALPADVWLHGTVEYNGHTMVVAAIRCKAFMNCVKLRSLRIDGDIRDVRCRIFAGCTNLERVELGEGIFGVSVATFYGCSALKEVKLPRSVQGIEAEAFAGCTALTSVRMVENEQRVIDATAFAGCKQLEAEFPDATPDWFLGDKWDCVVLPDGSGVSVAPIPTNPEPD